jgi:hypothetical protein
VSASQTSNFATKEKLEIVRFAAKPLIFAGISSPPQAAKYVRTILRMEHHVGNCKFEGFASPRFAPPAGEASRRLICIQFWE